MFWKEFFCGVFVRVLYRGGVQAESEDIINELKTRDPVAKTLAVKGWKDISNFCRKGSAQTILGSVYVRYSKMKDVRGRFVVSNQSG